MSPCWYILTVYLGINPRERHAFEHKITAPGNVRANIRRDQNLSSGDNTEGIKLHTHRMVGRGGRSHHFLKGVFQNFLRWRERDPRGDFFFFKPLNDTVIHLQFIMCPFSYSLDQQTMKNIRPKKEQLYGKKWERGLYCSEHHSRWDHVGLSTATVCFALP